MAVKIKLKRLGKIRQAQYRIIVADARTKRDGRAIEEIGLYHPKEEPSRIEVDSERAQYWLSVGAQPTERVETILKVTGDWQRFKGLPGAEGTLRTAPPRPDRRERYDALMAEAKSAEGDAPRRSARKAATAPAAPAAEPVSGPVSRPVSGPDSGPATEAPASTDGGQA